MSLTLRILAVSTALALSTMTALADTPPSCPGGGTATGTFSCTGPVLKPVCTEGPPWKCTIKDDKPATATMGDGGTTRPPRHLDVAAFATSSLAGTSSGADIGPVGPAAPAVPAGPPPVFLY
jgi:hypothetical protein